MRIGVKSREMEKIRARFIQYLVLFLFFFSLSLMLSTSDIIFDQSIESLGNLTRWNRFDFFSWVGKALIERSGSAAVGIERYLSDEEQAEIVLKYFQQSIYTQELEDELQNASSDPKSTLSTEELEEMQTLLEDETRRMHAYARVAESIVQNQTERSLLKLGFGVGGQTLPPVLFKISDLPLNLIISPREVIGTLESYNLKAGMDSIEKDRLETQIMDIFNLSALVEPVGGVGAYPTMVTRTHSFNWLTEVVAHEWLHNYLSFYPLGVRYFESNEMRSMNETLANLAGKEIGRRTMIDYYPQYFSFYRLPGRETTTVLFEGYTHPFDFRAEMRKTRVNVDAMLEQGYVEQAERYMEARREYFWENGYHLRKINQAYFAFYGSYNDTPGGGAAGDDPIGPAVQNLRSQSSSLKAFVDKMKRLTSFEELLRQVE